MQTPAGAPAVDEIRRAKHDPAGRGGAIVNVSSQASRSTLKGQSVFFYGASKGALDNITQGLGGWNWGRMDPRELGPSHRGDDADVRPGTGAGPRIEGAVP